MPATMTQTRKKIATWKPSWPPSARLQIRPAARKPLYRPWLAASVFDAVANSGVRLNTLRPSGLSQKNISSARKYRCSSATKPIRICVTRCMAFPRCDSACFQRTLRRGDDARGAWQIIHFELVQRHRHVVAGDAFDRRMQVVQRMFGETRGDLA